MSDDEVVPQQGGEGKELAVVGCFVVTLIVGLVLIVGALVYFAIPMIQKSEEDKALSVQVEEEQRALRQAAAEQEEARRVTQAAAAEEAPAKAEKKEKKRSIFSKLLKKERKPVEIKATRIDLSGDMSAASDVITVSVLGSDIMHVQLAISAVAQKVELHIPAGLKVSPVDVSKCCSYAVSRSKTVTLEPGATEPVMLDAVGMNHEQFYDDVADVPFKIDGMAAGPIAKFIAAAEERSSSWGVAQAGVWILENNIARESLDAISIIIPDESAPDSGREAPVASDADIKTIKGMLSVIGVDPMAHILYSAARDERARLLKSVNYENPGPDYIKVLKSKALATYRDDTEVERALSRFANHHRRAEVRRAALENLLAIGVAGDADKVMDKVFYGDDYAKFIPALELFNRGDERSWPILSTYGDDPIMARYSAEALARAIKAKTGMDSANGEVLYKYWQRTVGWASLTDDRYKERIRRLVEQKMPEKNEKLAKALEDIVSDNEKTASYACGQLRSYRRNRIAFDALSRTALGHASKNIQSQAVYALGSFRDFNQTAVCEQLLRGDDARLLASVVSLIESVQFEGFEKVLEKAVTHKVSKVRRSALKAAGRSGALTLEGAILKLAKTDPDRYVQDSAMSALAEMKSAESIKIALKFMSSQNSREKYKGLGYMKQWRNDARALAILESYRDDPDIGTQVAYHLRRYGR